MVTLTQGLKMFTVNLKFKFPAIFQSSKEESSHLGREHDPEFIRRQLLKAADVGSVEKRIQSNRANIQRSAMNMEKNFVKK